MPNSRFLGVLFICHPHTFSAHTNSLPCHINYWCLSNFHFLFMREITFVFLVKMKTKRRRRIKSAKDKEKVSVCLQNNRQAHYSNTDSDNELSNVREHWSSCFGLLGANVNESDSELFVLHQREVKVSLRHCCHQIIERKWIEMLICQTSALHQTHLLITKHTMCYCH